MQLVTTASVAYCTSHFEKSRSTPLPEPGLMSSPSLLHKDTRIPHHRGFDLFNALTNYVHFLRLYKPQALMGPPARL